MIIVSQNRDTILNFENIQDIRIEEYGTHNKGIKTYKIFSGNFEGYATLLGTYKTREKAKEVLQEITRLYRMFQGLKYCGDSVKIGIIEETEKSGHQAFIFKMPTE